MKTTKEVKEFCAHNLVAIIAQDIKKYLPNIDDTEFLADFTSSKTYTQLFDEETRLWAEGSDYIMNLYFEEKGINPYGGV